MATFYRYDVIELGNSTPETGMKIIWNNEFPIMKDYPYTDESFEKQFFSALGYSEEISNRYDGSAADFYTKSIELGFIIKVSDVVYTDLSYLRAKIEIWYPTEEIYNSFKTYIKSKNSIFSKDQESIVPEERATTKFNVELNRPHPTPVPA